MPSCLKYGGRLRLVDEGKFSACSASHRRHHGSQANLAEAPRMNVTESSRRFCFHLSRMSRWSWSQQRARSLTSPISPIAGIAAQRVSYAISRPDCSFPRSHQHRWSSHEFVTAQVRLVISPGRQSTAISPCIAFDVSKKPASLVASGRRTDHAANSPAA